VTEDAQDWGFPSFAKDFPPEPKLAELTTAFARGDYATVRRGASKLASESDDDAVKRAAQLLLERTRPDPTAKVLFILAAALLAFLTIWWVTHDGPP
jgi:hypothetical protein